MTVIRYISTLTHWWLAYDVIKNIIMQIMINLPQLFYSLKDITMCLCIKFEVVRNNENIVVGPRSWRIFYYVTVYMGKWVGRHFFAHHHGCCNIIV